MSKSSRRTFIKTAGGAILLAMTQTGMKKNDSPGAMRSEGMIDLPAVGLDGKAMSHGEEAKTQRVIDGAIDLGFTFFDAATTHISGRTERRYGLSLTPKYRDKIFLQTRCKARTKATAHTEIGLSLARMNTDRIDSYLIESVIGHRDGQSELPDPDTFEALVEAKKSGKLKYTGLRSTGDTSNLVKLMKEYGREVDCIMLPFNSDNRDPAIVLAQEKNIAVIADVDVDAQNKAFGNKEIGFTYPKHFRSWVLSFNNIKTMTNSVKQLKEVL